jgi:ribosome-binding ATPase YchF (GTP1/OBG family)
VDIGKHVILLSTSEVFLTRLPKIKAWIDENNPGDPLIPFSVALEERLAPLSLEEKEEEQKKAGAQSALGKITQAGYTSLDVSLLLCRLMPLFIYLVVVNPVLHLWSG